MSHNDNIYELVADIESRSATSASTGLTPVSGQCGCCPETGVEGAGNG